MDKAKNTRKDNEMKKFLAVFLIACMAAACVASVSTAAGNVTTDASKLSFDPSLATQGCIGFTNNTTATVVEDDTEAGYSLKLTSKSPYTDPFTTIYYNKYVSTVLKLTPPQANDVKYIVVKCRSEFCMNNVFEIFYCTSGGVSNPTGGYSVVSNFEMDTDEWQYVVFNMSSAKGWSGTISQLRLDWEQNASGAGESMYVNQLIFAKNAEELLEYTKPAEGTGEDLHALTEAQQALAEKLIADAADTAPEVPNEPLTAEYEDPALLMWFDHSYYKTPGECVTHNGQYTYQMRLAKNETECAQMVLASSQAYEDLTVEVSDFVNSGASLKPVIYYGYYFDDVEGQSIVDPIPELREPISLSANKSQMFLIKIKTTKDTPAGQYSATLTVKDKDGKEIKKANVYAYVWNFTLPDASNVKTLADLGWYSIYAMDNVNGTLYGDDNGCKCGQDSPYHAHSGLTYKNYYDTLLENKVNAYGLPYVREAEYGGGDSFEVGVIKEYLDDPRVQAFNPIGYSKAPTNDNITRAYNFLSVKDEWLEKAYFYTVDEPMDKNALDKVRNHANLIKSIWGSNYKLITPMHWNSLYDREYKLDAFEYVKGYVNIWCPHTFFFNTYADKQANPLLTYRCYKRLEENLGTFPERMAAEQAKGNEVWWYVTRYPHYPEITLSISDPAVDHRILFWQQKLYNVDGFLYYSVNDWYQKASDGTWGWDKKKEVSTDSFTPYTVYGNGVLVYHGGKIGRMHEAVESIRLEQIRDGIEDYDYFVLLDERFGEGTSDLLIKQVTTSLGNFKSDIDLFTQIRIAVGNMIEQGPKGMAGDINRDGSTDNQDVVALFKYVSGGKVDPLDPAACDCNGDGSVDNLDVIELFKYVSNPSRVIYYGGVAAGEPYTYNGVTVTLPKGFSIYEPDGVPTAKGPDSESDVFNFATDAGKTIHGLGAADFVALYKNQGFTDASCTNWKEYEIDGKNAKRGDFTLVAGDAATFATVVIIEADAGDIMISFARTSDKYERQFNAVIDSIKIG